jgi:hypothetical protein
MPSAGDHVRELILDAFGNASGLATVDLPDGSIGVIDLDKSLLFVVTIQAGKFEVAS